MNLKDIIMETALSPFRVAISRPAQKAYISTLLLAITNLLLIGIAVTAYSLFYFSYVPQIGLERVVHLQFGSEGPVYGTSPLSSDLVSFQPYDISISLHLPRTPSNLAAGNFMLELSLLSTATSDMLLTTVSKNTIAHSRRPAIMTYTSPFVDIVIRCARIPWYVLGWRNEAETLDITMMEGIEFQRGRSNVPTSLRLEVQSHERMQVYDAKVRFVARFWGLRWMMYNHRIISLLVFTTGFWAVELSFTFLAWLLLSSYFSSPRKETKEIKRDLETDSQVFKTEEDTDALFTEGLSDTERTFPTFSRQPPLRYNNSKIKDEEKEERASGMINTIPPVAEADDEDDELVDIRVGRGGRTDSGLGTSMEESGGRRDDIRRRRAKLFGGNTGGA